MPLITCYLCGYIYGNMTRKEWPKETLFLIRNVQMQRYIYVIICPRSLKFFTTQNGSRPFEHTILQSVSLVFLDVTKLYFANHPLNIFVSQNYTTKGVLGGGGIGALPLTYVCIIYSPLDNIQNPLKTKKKYSQEMSLH